MGVNFGELISQLRTVPLRGLLTVIGGFLVHTTISTGYIFGNMNPYLTSYLRARSQSGNVTYSDTIWISTANYVSMAVSMPVLGWVERRIEPRFCTLIGGILFNTGLALTYFTMQHSLPLTVLTYGVLNGASKGMVYPAAVKSALKWFPNRAGLVTGIIICGIGFGTFVFNQIVTKFINPENFSPDEVVKDDLFFTQAPLLDNVPYCFLLLAGVYTAIQLVAVLVLMSSPQKSEVKDDDVSKVEDDKNLDKKKHINNQITEDIKQEPGICLEDEDGASNDGEDDYTPLQVLKTKVFYLFWVIYACVVLGIFFVMNFYKTFSQTFIKDDYFLALAGSVGSAFNAIGRPVWGAVGDKLGYRETLVIVIAVFGSAGATFTLCEYGGKAMLMVWLCLIYGTFSGFYALAPSLMVDLYGQKYYSVNYGLLFTCQIFVQLVGALLTSQLKSAIGWQGILYIGASGIIFSFLLMVGWLVRYRLQKKKQKKYSTQGNDKTMDTKF